METMKAKIEAALFIASDPVKLEELAKIIDETEDTTEEILEDIIEDLKAEHRGISLLKVSDTYQLKVKNEHLEHVSHLTPYADMGKGLLKVLALICYKQPITQSDVVKTIGNKAYAYVDDLVGRGLVTTEKFGRTKLLNLTDEFMSYFGIKDRSDLIAMFQKENNENEQEDNVDMSLMEDLANVDFSKS